MREPRAPVQPLDLPERHAHQPLARRCRDHDPLPLLAQIAQRYGDRISVEYRQREPGAIVIDFSVL